MEYKIPDPKIDPLSCLVLSYKTLKGVDYDERTWDSVNWGRAAKSAKLLLAICGGFRQADTCLVEVSGQFEEDEISWTLETIVKHAHEWTAKKQGVKDGRGARQRLFSAFAKQRAAIQIADIGKDFPGREISNGVRDMPLIQTPAKTSDGDST